MYFDNKITTFSTIPLVVLSVILSLVAPFAIEGPTGTVAGAIVTSLILAACIFVVKLIIKNGETINTEAQTATDKIAQNIEKSETISKELNITVVDSNTAISDVEIQTSGIEDATNNTIRLFEDMTNVISDVNKSILEAEDYIKRDMDLSNELKESYRDVVEIVDEGIKKIDSSKHIVNVMETAVSQALQITNSLVISMEKIGAILEEMNSIASQTSLLPLNASIEAARAGESGKGFSVVADEIRNLADATKDTVTAIQSISATVNESVSELVSCTNDIMKYVSTNVIEGYDNFVSVSENYEKDSLIMSDVLEEFNDKTQKLNRIITKFTDGVSSISQSINECTLGVEHAAHNVDSLVIEIENISQEVKDNKNIALSTSYSNSTHDEYASL